MSLTTILGAVQVNARPAIHYRPLDHCITGQEVSPCDPHSAVTKLGLIQGPHQQWRVQVLLRAMLVMLQRL